MMLKHSLKYIMLSRGLRSQHNLNCSSLHITRTKLQPLVLKVIDTTPETIDCVVQQEFNDVLKDNVCYDLGFDSASAEEEDLLHTLQLGSGSSV